MKKLLALAVLVWAFLLASSAPPTCYSRVLSLGKEITASYVNLQKSETVEPCVKTLPRLYLDIHNYCVLAKLREFVAYPRCRRVPQVNALKDKARSLYTIMTSFCRRLINLPHCFFSGCPTWSLATLLIHLVQDSGLGLP